MTISAYSSAIVDAMLGWLKSFANWVLLLFNLAGSSGTSPLLWLSQNWLRLFIVLAVIGVAGDLLVWFVRWRPHWVWFRRERVIVDDEHFFNDYGDAAELDPEEGATLRKNWQERDYVVASTVVARRGSDSKKRSASRRISEHGRPEDGEGRARASFQRGERRRPIMHEAAQAPTAFDLHQNDDPAHSGADMTQGFFDENGSHPGVTDYYEDEVFNVNSLPKAEEYPAEAVDAQIVTNESEA